MKILRKEIACIHFLQTQNLVLKKSQPTQHVVEDWVLLCWQDSKATHNLIVTNIKEKNQCNNISTKVSRFCENLAWAWTLW
jgi:hypothetical protein